MIYDLSNEIQRQQAETKFEYLIELGKRIELKVKHPKRSISQNSYLHLILSAFGQNFGYTLEETKQEIFKNQVNLEIFYVGKKGKLITISEWRSTADLNTKELTLAIDRFLDYSAKNGYLLPDPSNLVWIEQLEQEIENNKQYL
jgi:hypothetical protein